MVAGVIVVRLSLADSGTPKPANESTPAGDVVLNVKADGTIVVNRRTLSTAELSGLLKGVVQLNSQQKVIIRPDEKCAYKDIVEILNICTKAGVTNVAFALPQPDVQQPDEKKSFDQLLKDNQTRNALPDLSPLPTLPTQPPIAAQPSAAPRPNPEKNSAPMPDALPTPPPTGVYGEPLKKYNDSEYREFTPDGGYFQWRLEKDKNGTIYWLPQKFVPPKDIKGTSS
jgi:biopolymer transport protein ExbD